MCLRRVTKKSIIVSQFTVLVPKPICTISFSSCRIIWLLSPFERPRKYIDQKKTEEISKLVKYPSGPYKNTTGLNILTAPGPLRNTVILSPIILENSHLGPNIHTTSTCWKNCCLQRADSIQGEQGTTAQNSGN